MRRLNFFQIGKACCRILALVRKKIGFGLLFLFLSVVLAFSSCERNGTIFFEAQLQKPPALSFNKLVTSSRNIAESDLLKQIPEGEKKGFTIKSIVVKEPYKAFAQVAGTKSNFSLNLKKEGTFTVKIVLEQDEYHDVVINDAEIELRGKQTAKVLRFDRLTTAYKSSLSKAEILGQVQGEKAGYTLKSIAVNTAFAQVAGTAPNISLTLKKVGTFTATIVLEHPNYEDATIPSAAFEITKGAAKTLTFDRLVTDKGTVTSAEILRQIQGEKTNYTLKSISSITPNSAATVRGTAPDLSLALDTTKPSGFTFTATIVLEHPLYEDVTITGATFEKEETKYIFDIPKKTITGVRAKYRTDFKTKMTVLTFPDQINGVNVEVISGNDASGQNIFYDPGPGGNNIQTIHLPKNLKTIGDRAFSGFDKLTSITISDSVTSIGGAAFMFCRDLKSITLPNSVTSIGVAAFVMCTGLTSITLSNTLTTIKSYAFRGCIDLTSITIPASVTKIGYYVFDGAGVVTAGVAVNRLVITIEQTDPTKIRVAISAFDNALKIKVPDASLARYKAEGSWSKWQGKMEGY